MADDRLDDERRRDKERRRQSRERLQAAIDGLRASEGKAIDSYASETLARLSRDDAVIRALSTKTIDDRVLRMILLSCIEAELLSRTFHSRLKAEADMQESLKRLPSAVDEIAAFVRHLQAPSDRLSATVSTVDIQTILDRLRAAKPSRPRRQQRGHAPTIEDIEPVLDLLRRLIEARQRMAIETTGRIGATRKRGPNAARIAAHTWIEQGIERAMGSGQPRLAAILGEAIFPEDIVDEENLRKTSAKRKAKDWRLPLGWRGTFEPK